MSQRAEACLIAGCGDTGIRIARLLVAQGTRVYGLRRRVAELPPSIVPVVADLADAASLAHLPADVTTLVYLPTPAQRTPADYQSIFREGLKRLLLALPQGGAELRRIVFVSSSAVYGEHEGAWVDERSKCRPLSFNGEVLLDTEQWLLSRHANACVLRFAGIYGPGRTQLITQIRSGHARLNTQSDFYTNRIHVDDAAAATVHVLGLAQVAPIYNVVDDVPALRSEVYDWIADSLALARVSRDGLTSTSEVGNKRLSNALLRASGFDPRYADYRAGYRPLLEESMR